MKKNNFKKTNKKGAKIHPVPPKAVPNYKLNKKMQKLYRMNYDGK